MSRKGSSAQGEDADSYERAETQHNRVKKSQTLESGTEGS